MTPPTPAESVRLLTLARDLARESSTVAKEVGEPSLMAERLDGAAIAFDTAIGILEGREAEASLRSLYAADELALLKTTPNP